MHCHSEPNLNFFSSLSEPNATAYGNFAHGVCEAVLHAGLGAETVVGPALALGTPGPGNENLELAGPFLRQLLQLGGGKLPPCFDAVSVHPYQSGPPERAMAQYKQLRQLVSLPVVTSEWGWSTCAHPCLTKDMHVTTEAQQAKYLVRSWLASALAGVELVVWYDYVDGHAAAQPPYPNGTYPLTANASLTEDNYGATRTYADTVAPHAPKQSFVAAKTAQTVLGGGSRSVVGPINVTRVVPCPLCGPVFGLELGPIRDGQGSSQQQSQTHRDDTIVRSTQVFVVWGVGYDTSLGASAVPLPSTAACQTPLADRTDCGPRGISPNECGSLGCCWDLSSRAGWSPGQDPPCYAPWQNNTSTVQLRVWPSSDQTSPLCFLVTSMDGEILPDVCADAHGWLELAPIGDAPIYLSGIMWKSDDEIPSKYLFVDRSLFANASSSLRLRRHRNIVLYAAII